MDIVEQAQADVRAAKKNLQCLDDDSIDLLFRKARSYHVFKYIPVSSKKLKTPDNCTQIIVPDPRLALGRLSAAFYNHPSNNQYSEDS